MVILRDVETPRPQAVSVQSGAKLLTICEGDQCWAVPRLHEAGVVLVEGPLLRLHVLGVLPGLGHDHHDDLREVAVACGKQQLDNVVEQSRVTANVLIYREELLHRHVAEGLRFCHESLSRTHLVPVALQSVDLAVVSDPPEGVRAVPRRERVRGESGVHDGQVCRALLRAQVQVVLEQLVRLELPLVGDRPRVEGANEELGSSQ
mmetsp:Transcript_106411/g.266657  ORF Transcript_106411/g.266657 Transcript_106411/m.266657 type:complete len:205 (+) Transcript_106411:625-1239(+)